METLDSAKYFQVPIEFTISTNLYWLRKIRKQSLQGLCYSDSHPSTSNYEDKSFSICRQ